MSSNPNFIKVSSCNAGMKQILVTYFQISQNQIDNATAFNYKPSYLNLIAFPIKLDLSDLFSNLLFNLPILIGSIK